MVKWLAESAHDREDLGLVQATPYREPAYLKFIKSHRATWGLIKCTEWQLQPTPVATVTTTNSAAK